ncbi:MAG: zinc finger-like domain-containing protein [Bacteroidetes bacterium]|nr:zinc finger-like domain-containing protein [Bacteroidota bacterium]
MILDNTQAYKVISDRPNKKLISAAQSYTKKLMMHVKGVGIDKYIDRILAFEKEDILKIRKKYAVSNKAMFSRVHRPIDKVFSAKGGSNYYNLGDVQTADLKDYLSNIVYGYSIKQWLEIFWMPAMSYDPMGLIMMEMDQQGKPYPTYKSILDIFEFQLNGRNLEYVIFKLDPKTFNLPTKTDPDKPQPQSQGDQKLLQAVKDGQGTAADLYRIIDDAFDRIVKVVNGTLVEVEGETYPNYWGKVPATIISNLYDPVLGMYISHDDEIIELADQFLREGSVKNIIMNYHGFPKAWEYQTACPECKGTKVLNGRPCDYCKGSGWKSQSFPEETIKLPVPQSKDQPMLAPEVAGFVAPPIEGINLYVDQLKLLETIMFRTKWGTQQVDDEGKNETATGKFIDIQPVNDALNKLSDATEMMEMFITDRIAEILVNPNYKGSSITYGRRFLIETPDQILKRLTDSIDKLPMSALYDIYDDYLQTQYSANALQLQYMQKLAKIEPLPFVNYTAFSRLQTFPDVILRRKFWFESWKNSKTQAEIITGDTTALQKDFFNYCLEQDTLLNSQVMQNPNINSEAQAAQQQQQQSQGKPASEKQAA